VLQLLLHRGFLAKACKDGAVIASSTYPLDVVAAGAIAKRASASFTYEVHDLWPLSPIELGGMSPRHPFIRVMQWAEDSAYHRVNHVISMLPSAESHMLAHGLASGKFHYVPNGIDPTEWGHSAAALPEPHLSVLSRLRSEKKFIIGYAGAHGVANALEIIVRAAGLLVDSQVTFVLVGQGPEKHNLQALATKLGIENVVFLLPVPKAAIPSLLSVMDGLIIASKCTSLYRFGVSQNKLMDYMMAGRPIIQAMDASNDLVSESGCGFSVPPDDPATIAKAVLQMMNLTIAERNEMGRCGRRYVEANHDCHKLATLFLDIICGGKTGPSVDYQAAPYPSR
jgi:glycosyltransferase involved in cell wall biosynthesis